MFEYIKGTLAKISPSFVVVENQGIGYLIFIPVSTFSHLPDIGRELYLYVSFIVREDSQKLFGFLTENQRNLFNKLIELSGMGPKTSLSLLGHLNYEQLQTAVMQNQPDMLAKVPGIGKKTAERLILELKEYFQKDASTLKASATIDNNCSDAVQALINLGYTKAKAEPAVRKAQEKLEGQHKDVASIIKKSLQII